MGVSWLPVHVCACGELAWKVIARKYVAFVDASDAAILQRPWSTATQSKGDKTYVSIRFYDRKSKVSTSLAAEILRPSEGKVPDHRNRNTLDNRRANLREATRSQNQANRSYKIGHSLPKGVMRSGNRYRAATTIGRKQHNLGSYSCPTAAHLAYRHGARRIHGEFARLD